MPSSGSSGSALRRAVRLTARTSGLLFAAAQAASALHSPGSTSRSLYHAFLVMHAIHFAAVARYAAATGGEALFPGPRSLRDAGGWRTVLAIYALFASLALTGEAAVASTRRPPPAAEVAGRVATGLIASMFVGAHLGQFSHARWRLLPALLIAVSAGANIVARRGRSSAPPE